ncbi:MAG TPA: T9SS type A sorting domain-containing protein, partial [Adhaeribacter sp.]|nr:T9SS type A sorting domain-containing protein [Adhaeribacter sp.]
TSDGGFLLAGSSNSGIGGDKSQPSFGGHDFWVVKLRADGSKAWDRTIGGSGNDHLAKMLLTPDGGCILAGSSNSDVSGIKTSPKKGTNSSSDYWLVKLSSSGVKIWDKTFGGDAEEELTSLALTADGGYILGGHSKSGISADKTEPNRGLYSTSDYWVVKTDAAGNLQWEKTLGGNQEDEMYGVAQLADGNYLAGGWSNSNIGHDRTSSGYGSASFWLVKLDTAGAKMWDHSLGGYGSDILMDLQVTSDRGLILGGFSTSQAGGDKTTPKYGDYDTWIIKLGAGILNLKELKPAFDLTLFPNPSHGKFQLHLTGLTASTAEVTVTDLLGRTILQQQFQTNNAQLSEEIRLPAATKGMYLLQVKAGGKITSRKIVVE